MKNSIPLFFSLAILCIVQISEGEPHPPNISPYAYGEVTDTNFGCTIEYASQEWLTLWFTRSGSSHTMPAPGYIQLAFGQPLNFLPISLELQFQVNGAAKKLSLVADDPVPLKTLEELADADQINIYANGTNSKDVAHIVITADMRWAINRLLSKRYSVPLPDPHLIDGRLGFAIDLPSANDGLPELLRKMLVERVEKPLSVLDQECIVYFSNQQVERMPSLGKGISYYSLKLERDRKALLSDVDSLAGKNKYARGDAGQLIRRLLDQEAKTIILITAPGAKIDFEKTLKLLSSHGARLFVYRMQNDLSISDVDIELNRIAEITRGMVKYIKD